MDESREAELEQTPLLKIDPSRWPNGVRSIGIGEMDAFGIDRHGILHWDGRPVVVQKEFRLTWVQAFFTFLFALATTLASVGQGLPAAHSWTCQIGWLTWKCPESRATCNKLTEAPITPSLPLALPR